MRVAISDSLMIGSVWVLKIDFVGLEITANVIEQVKRSVQSNFQMTLPLGTRLFMCLRRSIQFDDAQDIELQ